MTDWNSYYDDSALAAARVRLAENHERQMATQRARADAQAALAAAEKRRAELVEQSARGGNVPAAEVVAAAEAVAGAKIHVAHLDDALKNLMAEHGVCQTAIMEAQSAGALPIARAAAAARLSAADKIEAAQAALDAAQTEYDDCTAGLSLAAGRGWRAPVDALPITGSRLQTLEEQSRVVRIRYSADQEVEFARRARLL